MEDRVRVLRLVEYEGPRSWVEDTIQRAVQGTRIVNTFTKARITAVTIDSFPEILEAARGEVVEDQS